MKNRMKEIRTEKNINQTDMAERCGVSRQTIHAIEVDKYTPSVALALKIASILETTVEDIFILEDKK